MSKLPESKEAVYANGTAISRDFAMADMKAKTIAFASICMAAGGEVDKSSKIYMSDNESAGAEQSEVAIRSMCRKVDVSGAEVVETKRIAENGRYRTFVLLALPTGEANAIVKRKDQLRANKNAAERSDRAFTDLDKQ
jgi:predicted ATPase